MVSRSPGGAGRAREGCNSGIFADIIYGSSPVTPAAHDHDEDGEHRQDGAADHRRDDDQEGDALCN